MYVRNVHRGGTAVSDRSLNGEWRCSGVHYENVSSFFLAPVTSNQPAPVQRIPPTVNFFVALRQFVFGDYPADER